MLTVTPHSYQDLAIEARDSWVAWNKAIAEASASALPGGLTTEDQVFHNCGTYFLAEGAEMRDYYADSLKNMEKTAPEFRKMQFVKVPTLNSPTDGYASG